MNPRQQLAPDALGTSHHPGTPMPITMPTTLYACVADRTQLQEVVGALQHGGFRPDDVSFLIPDRHVDASTVGSTRAGRIPDVSDWQHAEAPGTVGLLASLGTLAVSGLGVLFATGPLAALIGGSAAGTAMTGGLTGSLIGLGIAQHQAQRYEDQLRAGGILISVRADDQGWSELAQTILTAHGASDITHIVDDPSIATQR